LIVERESYYVRQGGTYSAIWTRRMSIVVDEKKEKQANQGPYPLVVSVNSMCFVMYVVAGGIEVEAEPK
jgi:hypothetical protein